MTHLVILRTFVFKSPKTCKMHLDVDEHISMEYDISEIKICQNFQPFC